MSNLIDQKRWDDKGSYWLEKIKQNPDDDQFIFNDVEETHKILGTWEDVKRELGDVKGKKILEIGCSRGVFSIFLAKQGAIVTGIDVGENLILAAKEFAKINNVDCNFKACSAADMKLDETYDVIIGFAVLHHMNEESVLTSFRDFYRLLKNNGIAIFTEPVENSKSFEILQNIIPIPERPSILQRNKWKTYYKNLDDRPMSNNEFIYAGKVNNFRSTKIFPHGLIIRLSKIFGKKNKSRFISANLLLKKFDKVLFKFFPILKRYCRQVVVVYRK